MYTLPGATRPAARFSLEASLDRCVQTVASKAGADCHQSGRARARTHASARARTRASARVLARARARVLARARDRAR
eukprot:1442398-Pyramimonas_sp.AAC.1